MPLAKTFVTRLLIRSTTAGSDAKARINPPLGYLVAQSLRPGAAVHDCIKEHPSNNHTHTWHS
jgi:hypothetical protein